jgi:hypothetical protein
LFTNTIESRLNGCDSVFAVHALYSLIDTLPFLVTTLCSRLFQLIMEFPCNSSTTLPELDELSISRGLFLGFRDLDAPELRHYGNADKFVAASSSMTWSCNCPSRE